MIITILAFAVVAGVIITIHELGHFLAARATGMRVKKFSIGFPPKLYSKVKGDTEYSISWIPLGGYVQIAGMVDESLDDEGVTGAPDEFMSKNPFQKTFVLAAGVMMNYITAFLLVVGVTLAVGIGELDKSTKIGDLTKDYPAEKAGLKANDEILSVNGTATPTWEDLIKSVSGSTDSVALVIKRQGAAEPFSITLQTKEIKDERGATRHIIGIARNVLMHPASMMESINQGWQFCYRMTSEIIGFIASLIRGEGSLSQISGPLGVAKMSGESAKEGPGAFLSFIAFVSVSIAFLNILPFPALDGGHIMYVIIEAIIRRPIPTKIKLAIQQVGMVMLLLLVLFASFHDVMRFFEK
jgi:regulator of sigma E protease